MENKGIKQYGDGVKLAVKATEQTRNIFVSNAKALTKSASIIKKAVDRCLKNSRDTWK